MEKPAGSEDMGGWTQAIFTPEQMKRLHVTKLGEKVNYLQNMMIGPAWTYDSSVEKPAGTENMGTWTQAVYTPEQMKKLHVTKLGEKVDYLQNMMIGPAWTYTPGMEKPAGTENIGTWT